MDCSDSLFFNFPENFWIIWTVFGLPGQFPACVIFIKFCELGNFCESGEFGDFGETGEFGESGDFSKCADSGGSNESGESGQSGDALGRICNIK